MQWVKSDAAPKQAEDDFTSCRQEAWREARMRSAWFHRPMFPYAVQDATGRRFLVWPRSGFNDSMSDEFMEESRLTHFCMRAKGYALVPVEKGQPATPK